MRRAAAGAAAVVALTVPAVAHATATHDAATARKGITLAVQRHWVKPDDAQRYRGAVTHALSAVKTLPRLRADVIASQLSQLTPLWDSYTSPRALSLFSQLDANVTYLWSHRLPDAKLDITDDDGVVYRWFPNLGFEFHPLANFGVLNSDAVGGDAEATQTLADALVARGIPRGNRLLWEYQFRFGSGRPPWASGMAQAVAAQALARSSVLLDDPTLGAAAVRAFASVPPLLLPLASGPWIRLYGFDGEVVLNAQLQAIVSLLDYAQNSEDGTALVLAQQLDSTAQKLFPRFDTGDWSRYELGGGYAPRDYQKFVTDLLAKLAQQTQDPFWITAAQTFHAYYYDPPQVTQTTPTPAIWPQPLDGYLDVAPIAFTLSMRASVTLAVGGRVSTYKLNAGQRTITFKPPPGMTPGTYPVQVSATSYAGHRRTYTLAPLVVGADTAPPPLTATLSGTTLSWQVAEPGTPWLDLAVDYTDPAAVNPPQTVDLGHFPPVNGTATLTIPPGTWNVTLRATNSAGLATSVPLGTITQPS
jgi:hypothetical protein